MINAFCVICTIMYAHHTLVNISTVLTISIIAFMTRTLIRTNCVLTSSRIVTFILSFALIHIDTSPIRIFDIAFGTIASSFTVSNEWRNARTSIMSLFFYVFDTFRMLTTRIIPTWIMIVTISTIAKENWLIASALIASS